MSMPQWTEAHKKEKEFVDKKIRARMLQALDENQLLPGETCDKMSNELQDKLKTQEAEQRKREQQQQSAQTRALGGLDINTFEAHMAGGKSVFLNSASPAASAFHFTFCNACC